MSTSETLKSLRESVNWEVERERYALLNQLYLLIRDWKGQLPDIRDIFHKKEIELLLSDSIIHDESSFEFIRFVARSGYKDEPEFDEDGKPLLRRTTPVHSAHKFLALVMYRQLIDDLFRIYDRYDVNYTNENGFTHFHVACEVGCEDVVVKFLELGQDPNCLVPATGESPLHLALKHKDNKRVVELLLRNGADRNLASKNGTTPLHVACQNLWDNVDMAETLLEIGEETHQPVQVDARNDLGNTPLNWAVRFCNKKAVELLLRKGADPNLANAEGSTPLHIVCHSSWGAVDLAEMFFKTCKDVNRTVQLDERDKLGNTPLHVTLIDYYRHDKRDLVRLLLQQGANPNLANTDGLTPLHAIIRRNYDNDDPLSSVKLFFKITDEREQTVQVNAVDDFGWTPLQLAVAHLEPEVVDILLNRGADVSNFVFPSKSQIDEIFKRHHCHSDNSKLILASEALAVVERLESAGHELDRDGALAMVKTLFVKYDLFDRWTENYIDWIWCDDDENFVTQGKGITMRPGLSLYDLTQLRPKRAEKLLTIMDYVEFARSGEFSKVPRLWHEACLAHLCEKLARRFFRRWALDAFLKLTNYRLPIVCCDLIIELLMNKDLLRICSAATGKSSRWR